MYVRFPETVASGTLTYLRAGSTRLPHTRTPPSPEAVLLRWPEPLMPLFS